MNVDDDDDTVVAKALLLGCQFYPHGGEDTGDGWWVLSRDEEHPLEEPRALPWLSKAELAREYVAYTLKHGKEKQA
jgi:hypothetical protein